MIAQLVTGIQKDLSDVERYCESAVWGSVDLAAAAKRIEAHVNSIEAENERLRMKVEQYYDQLCNGWSAILSVMNDETRKRCQPIADDIEASERQETPR